MVLRSLTSRVVFTSGAIIFSSIANADVVILPGGGLANGGFSSIGHSDPRFDTIRFLPDTANKVVIYTQSPRAPDF